MIYNIKSRHYYVLRFLLIIITIFFSINNIFAEETKPWTIGAKAFTYSQDIKRSEYEKAVLKTIPQLILDHLHGLKGRNVPADELLDRKIDELVKERLALFLELSKESKVRDSYVLKDFSGYQFKKNISLSEKKIAEIQEKIEANLEQQEKLIAQYKDGNTQFENFALYKNYSDSLFEISDKNTEDDFFSYNFSSEVTKANINGLITGTIVTYGSYAAVSVELILYPGAKSTGVITEVGSFSKIETIAKNIAYRLIPKIENSIPCDVTINLVNEDLRKDAKLTVDSTIYDPIPKKLVLSTGVHNLTFECKNFRKESFSYGFGYEKKYVIEIDFVENVPIQTAFNLKTPIQGNLFYNGTQSDDNVISVKINNHGVLGYYLTEDENSLFFMIPKEKIENGSSVNLNLINIDVGQNIDKRRKMMYISYSALICSLPYLFYSYSNYNNLYRSYSTGNHNIDLNELQTYQTMSYIGIGLSAGIGVWFIYELVQYLIAANKALPVEAKKSSVTFEQSVSDFESMQLMFKAMAEEEKKRQEAEKQLEEENKTTEDSLSQENIEEKQ